MLTKSTTVLVRFSHVCVSRQKHDMLSSKCAIQLCICIQSYGLFTLPESDYDDSDSGFRPQTQSMATLHALCRSFRTGWTLIEIPILIAESLPESVSRSVNDPLIKVYSHMTDFSPFNFPFNGPSFGFYFKLYIYKKKPDRIGLNPFCQFFSTSH